MTDQQPEAHNPSTPSTSPVDPRLTKAIPAVRPKIRRQAAPKQAAAGRRNLQEFNDQIRSGEIPHHGRGGRLKHGLSRLLNTGRVPPDLREEVRTFIESAVADCGGRASLTREQLRIISNMKLAETVVVMAQKEIGKSESLTEPGGEVKPIVKVAQSYITLLSKLEKQLGATMPKKVSKGPVQIDDLIAQRAKMTQE